MRDAPAGPPRRHALGAAQALLSRSPSLLAKECEPHTPAADAPRVVLRCFWDARDEAQWIARHVAAQRKSHPAYRYSDFAVLVRSQELAAALAPPLLARAVHHIFELTGDHCCWFGVFLVYLMGGKKIF